MELQALVRLNRVIVSKVNRALAIREVIRMHKDKHTHVTGAVVVMVELEGVEALSIKTLMTGTEMATLQ